MGVIEAQSAAKVERDRTVENAVRSALRPPDRRPIWQWCEEHLVLDDSSALAAGQKWRSEASPWSRRIMEAFQDPRVSRITVRCAAQTAKTQTILGILCWIIAEDPGPTLWVTASRDDVATFIKNRVDPTFERCKPVKARLRAVGDGSTKGNYSFDGMTFELVGAGSPSKLQSRPIKYLILDECRNYPDGALEMAQKRTRTYEKLGAKTIIITTGDREGDAVDVEYKSGTQETWRYPCMGCGAEVALKFGDISGDGEKLLRFGDDDDPKHTRYKDERGRWDFDRLAPTIRHVCPHCGHAHHDVPEVRRHIERKGVLVAENANAPADHVSLSYPAMLAGWVSWRKVVEEFINAMGSLKLGGVERLKTWVNETCGDSWTDRLRDVKATDRLMHLRGDYSLGAEVPEGWRVLGGADRQAKNGDHYYWVVRAFGPGGESRLVGYGIEHAGPGLEERLDDVRKRHNIRGGDWMVDSGYKAIMTYQACVRYGWRAMKGEPDRFWTELDISTGLKVRKLWKKVFPEEFRKVAGKAMPLFLWSNPSYKDAFEHILTGVVTGWTIASDTDDEYCRQLTAEERREVVVGRKTEWHWVKVRKDDHFRDSELMILVGAIERGFVKICEDRTESGE